MSSRQQKEDRAAITVSYSGDESRGCRLLMFVYVFVVLLTCGRMMLPWEEESVCYKGDLAISLGPLMEKLHQASRRFAASKTVRMSVF